ncbi:DNA-binding transcriptional regulator, PadR family [Sinosporangium album]|uniref:DNA-binding transcriptional regulator, PadR family n=1 Tax=Sinosporangium album TaxID=504805 RepID=A0A1G8H840_9ACTN|nr:helix-turn-helix transcriptional regulator [Sinosporangium album]SDI02828.1 DNA-binding transcriptional regulator, PadR family [Sinosporangium album]
MSPVFGHGRLRLYLLRLLEESPKHGYEVIRLLQDRFLGVYSPSPGTIYPRLARLEEEGLVTHEVIAGKKVFSITDKGRAELHARVDELDELEQEISDSVRDIAREVKEDVRATVRSLRDELTQMAKDVRREGAESARRTWQGQQEDMRRVREQQKEEWERTKERHRTEREEWAERVRSWQSQASRHGQELRDILTGMWSDLSDAAANRKTHADLDAELGAALADFVALVRKEADAERLSTETVDEVRAVLDETAARMRDILRA